jgi:predicted RecB family nuclease
MPQRQRCVRTGTVSTEALRVQIVTGRLSLSPSDVTNYLACEHLTTLSVRVARGDLALPGVENEQAELVFRKCREHELAYLERLRAEGRHVVEISLEPDLDWERAARETEEAVAAGVDVVYQGVLVSDGWRGVADFLERQLDGAYHAVDTKLARHAKPAYILQLCFYSEQLARIQGREPAQIHVLLGNGERKSFRPQEFAAYARRVRRRLEEFVAAGAETIPYPNDHCGICDFLPICDGWWDETDSLSRVAGLWRRHAEELTAAGIGTLATLARANPGEPPPGLNAEAFAKLQRQAELQLHRRETGELRYVLLQPQPEHGLTLLPDPPPGDLFFDLEGNPFWDEQGSLEYLWGILDTAGEYRALWADDHASERRALEQTVDLIHARLAEHPDLHVYHYAAYEITALRRLMGRYGTREAEVDDLLRRDVFVDLLKVVRGLAAARPELLERRPGWGTRAGGELLELEPLSTDDCVRMLDDLLTGGLSTELSELVVERAEGNPFFVEELLGVLIDRGLLARE